MPNIKEPDNCATFLAKCGRYDLIEFERSLYSLVHALEIKSITSGFRDVNVFYLSQSCYDEQLQELMDNGLLFQPILRIKEFGGFSHKHELVDEIGPSTAIYGAISQNNSKLKKFKGYVNENDDYNMGLMLGYPECCCRGYVDYSHRFLDPVWEIAQNTPPGDIPWDLQIHLRYFGFRVIPFFPCSYRCEAARETAKEWFSLMRSIDSKTAEALKTLMLEPSTWSLYNSQVIVNKPPTKANFIGYATSSYCPRKKEVSFHPI